jgi:hypothetical protein
MYVFVQNEQKLSCLLFSHQSATAVSQQVEELWLTETTCLLRRLS